jgi:uncharacterized membrane protein
MVAIQKIKPLLCVWFVSKSLSAVIEGSVGFSLGAVAGIVGFIEGSVGASGRVGVSLRE